MAEVFALTDADRRIIQEMVSDFRKRRENTEGRPTSAPNEDPNYLTPEVYLVRIPTGGIAGFDDAGTTGTGTADALDDTFSSAQCLVYRLIDGVVTGTGVIRRVYNLSDQDLDAGDWVLAWRDKWGTWFTLGMPAGVSTTLTAACAADLSWLSGLRTGRDCPTDPGSCILLTVVSAAGHCSGIDTTQSINLSYSSTDSMWLGDTSFVTPVGSFYVYLDPEGCGGPCAYLKSVLGGALRPLLFNPLCSGSQCVVFSGPGAASGNAICNGTWAAPCEDNSFKLKFCCQPCPNPDYDGPGWYCISDTPASGTGSGSASDCLNPRCVYYDADPGLCVHICSGPWPTESFCNAVCSDFTGTGSPGTGTGYGIHVPCTRYDTTEYIGYVAVSNRVGCDLNGATPTPGECCADPLIPVTTGNCGASTPPCKAIQFYVVCEFGGTVNISCASANLRVYYTFGGAEYDGSIVAYSASPFVLVVDFSLPDTAVCTPGGDGCAFRATFT